MVAIGRSQNIVESARICFCLDARTSRKIQRFNMPNIGSRVKGFKLFTTLVWHVEELAIYQEIGIYIYWNEIFLRF